MKHVKKNNLVVYTWGMKVPTPVMWGSIVNHYKDPYFSNRDSMESKVVGFFFVVQMPTSKGTEIRKIPAREIGLSKLENGLTFQEFRMVGAFGLPHSTFFWMVYGLPFEFTSKRIHLER